MNCPGAGWPALVDALMEAVWLVDAASLRIVSVNAAALALYAGPQEALVGEPIGSIVATPEDHLFWGEVHHGGDETRLADTLVRRHDGSLVPALQRITRLRHDGADLFLVALFDRSEQQHRDQERDRLVAELQATLESTADGILVTDLGGRVQAFNMRFASLWGLPDELATRRDDDAVLAWMRQAVQDGEAYSVRLNALRDAVQMQTSDVLTLKSGRVLERVTLPQLSRGQAIGRVFSFRDLTERLAAEERMEVLAQTDVLTGLPNRRLLADRIEFSLAMARRDGTPFALISLDLDRFKQINESLGQKVGDRVLREVSERVQGSLRQVDTIARLAGDEFALLIHGADVRGAEVSAQRVLEVMAQPFMVDGMQFTVTCSLGIALHPGDGNSVDELVKNAGRAMRGVKESGRASFRFHLPHQDVDARSRMRLDHAMRLGLARGEFRLHYQPQLDLGSGAPIGAEALLRWRDPERGDIAPGEFIPVAEESGFIVAMGDWVLQQAVRQAAVWHRRGWELPVAVNVSALQFQQPGFVGQVAAAVREAGLPAHLLELELTESILVRDADEALLRLRALRSLGVVLAIDDFGTGYSSLGYLKRFPIQRLKIDRSFVQGLPDDESDMGIVGAIVNLARALDLSVIAEGVETEIQRETLQAAGCDHYQGYLYAPALAVPHFEERLASWFAALPA